MASLKFSSEKKHYVYLLKCRDNSLYCGYTNSPEKRLSAHNSGKGAKYTKSRLPVELVYLEEYCEKSEAMRRECEIKRFTREEKLDLVKGYNKSSS